MSIKTKDGSSPKRAYKTLIDGVKLVFDNPYVPGRDILVKAGYKNPTCHTLYQKFKGCDFEKISLDEVVDLTNPGIEKFTVKGSEIFHYHLDDESETTDKKQLSANQILELGGLTPVRDYYLVEIDCEGKEISYKDSPDKPFEMKCPGSKFVSVFRGETPVSFKSSNHG